MKLILLLLLLPLLAGCVTNGPGPKVVLPVYGEWELAGVRV